mgnify:CR=1 FL=1
MLTLEQSQAAAAVGQIRLARAYEEVLAPHGITTAQVLVTLEDTEDRRRYLNSRATMETLLGLGVVLLLMKYLEVGPVAGWAWWIVLAPFGLAVAWWGWSDVSGRTQRKAMEKVDAKREARRQKAMDALGLQKPGRRR